MSLIAGAFEFLGIALIYPFILMIIKPDVITQSGYYDILTQMTSSQNTLLNAFVIGFCIFAMFIAKNLFMVFFSKIQTKFTINWKFDLSKTFMEYYIYSTYKQNLTELPTAKIYNIINLGPQVIDGYVMRMINFMTQVTIISMIVLLLFVKFPQAAVITTLFITLSMILHNKIFKKMMRKVSEEMVGASKNLNNSIINNVNNLKEIKILSNEDYFYEDYIEKQAILNKYIYKSSFYSSIPPYMVEILIVLALMILAGVISMQNINSSSTMVASYAIVVAAIFRIAPALNRIQTSVNNINSNVGFLKTLNNEYSRLKELKKVVPERIEFKEEIKLENVSYCYEKDKKIIKNLSLSIKKGDFIGIIGMSGAGKTTLVDILMGLLPPDSGKIIVDGVALSEEKLLGLRKLVGYVSQDISAFEGTLKENIAWGIEKEKISNDRVIEVLKAAQLWNFAQEKGGIEEFITTEMSGMSQGQKQRISVARALYRNPEILILDEATSALDVKTEHEITEMLNNLKQKKTIIAIAHRLTTLKKCNKLVYLKSGEIVDIGTFDELSEKYPEFSELIKLSSLQN